MYHLVRENINLNHEELKMPKKSCSTEQIISKLHQIEVLVAQGKSVAVACKEAGVSEQTYYRWRKEYGACGWIRPGV